MNIVAETLTLSSYRFADLIGCTYRQLDWWTRNDVFGDVLAIPGSGNRRSWTIDLLEAGSACADASRVCSSIGGQKMSPNVTVLTELVSVVGERPVDPGEFVAIGAGFVDRGYLTPTTSAAHLFVPLTPVETILRRAAA